MGTAPTEAASPVGTPDGAPLAPASLGASFERRLLPLVDAPTPDLSRLTLPPPLRPAAPLGVLDISEYFGETSGGVRTYLMQKARYVEARAHVRQVLIVPGAYDRIGSADGVRCYQLHGPLIPLQRTYRFLLATKSTRRIITHERPDIIEVGSAYFVPWIVRRATVGVDTPVVWFYHSNIPRLLAQRGEADVFARRMVAKLGWGYMRVLSRMVHTTIVASDFVRRDLEHAGITRVTRVPLGVDTELFHPRRREARTETRRRLGLPSGPVVLFVGRFSREKNLDLLLRAWPEIERRTDATLLVVGGGPLQARLDEAATRWRVRVLPFERDREALADIFAASDLLMALGPNETFGLAALEAMASGTPVLSCATGGVAEQVERSGAGAICPVDEPAVLAETAVRMLADDLRALGERGRAHAEREHTWDRVFDQIFDVYRNVVREWRS